MTITWDIDEARAVIRAQMAEANLLDEVIDDLSAETSAAIARAEAAEAEIEAVHRYLDECFVNDPDEGQAVPLIDRVVLLVSRIARDGGEANRLRAEVATLEALILDANQRHENDRAEVARLQQFN